MLFSSRWWSTYGCRVMLPKTSQAPFTIPPVARRTLQGGRWESTLVEPTGQRHAAPANAVPRRRAATGAAGAVAGRCGRELGNIDTGRRHHMAAMALQCYPTTCHIRGCRLPHTPAFKERAQVPTARPPVALQDEAMWWEEVAQFPGWLCCHLPPAAFCSSAIWQGAWI